MQFDQYNRLWIGGNGLLLNYDINSKKVIDLKQTKNLNVDFSFNQIQHLFIDRSNILWLGTSNKGVFKMDLENTSFSNSIDFTRNSKTYSSKFKNHPIQAMTVLFGGFVVLYFLYKLANSPSFNFWRYWRMSFLTCTPKSLVIFTMYSPVFKSEIWIDLELFFKFLLKINLPVIA